MKQMHFPALFHGKYPPRKFATYFLQFFYSLRAELRALIPPTSRKVPHLAIACYRMQTLHYYYLLDCKSQLNQSYRGVIFIFQLTAHIWQH